MTTNKAIRGWGERCARRQTGHPRGGYATTLFNCVIATALLITSGASTGRSAPAGETTGQTDQSRWWRGYLNAARHVRLPDGRRLTLFCEGRGAPLVILDVGLGGGAWGWARVQNAMARTTRVCSYDRAGYADSDPASTPRTFDAMAADLNALVIAAHLPEPYVMVGQSLGGPIVGTFAQQHPDKVAGLVFVDPSVGDQDRRMSAISSPLEDMAARLADARKCAAAADAGALRPGSAIEKSCVHSARPGFVIPAFAERRFDGWQHGPVLRAKLAETQGVDFATLKWPRNARLDVPLIVLTATETFAGEPKEKALWALWKSMHDEVAHISPTGANCVIPGATHSMMFSRPDAVISAVTATVAAVRSRSRAALDCDTIAAPRLSSAVTRRDDRRYRSRSRVS
ncbi:alpha/beta hydrolase [Sphingomonas koreensis]|nr:alpha/beta hydrolase [Sphingomonas koreensis]